MSILLSILGVLGPIIADLLKGLIQDVVSKKTEVETAPADRIRHKRLSDRVRHYKRMQLARKLKSTSSASS